MRLRRVRVLPLNACWLCEFKRGRMADEKKLLELRGRIDAVDQQLLELLRQRAAIIEEVRGAKGPQKIYIRPGREAMMLRALTAAPQGHVPQGLVHKLWREMIGAFTLQEGAMRVATIVPQGEEGFWDLVRDHFGGFTPLQDFAQASSALRAVLTKSCPLAALPIPQESDSDVWWRLLLLNDENIPNVFYAFPFDGARGNARACARGGLVLGNLKPEKTGADKSILVLEWNNQPEKNERQKIVQGLSPKLSRHVYSAPAGEPACSWLELDGFFDDRDEFLKHWLETHKSFILRARMIGAYPLPLKPLEVNEKHV